MQKLVRTIATAWLPLALLGLWPDAAAHAQREPHVRAAGPVEAGEYLTTIGGCNACHTMGWQEQGDTIPLRDRLMGSGVGYQGPWGTSYPANLRLSVIDMSERDWVNFFQDDPARAPIKATHGHALSARDASAIYAFLKNIGPKGERAPQALPPGEIPSTPYVTLVEPQS